MEEEKYTHLTDADLDQLSGIMILGFHMAELAMSQMEHEYARRYDGSKEYQTACKMYGKAYADSVVLDTVVRQLRGDQRCKVGELLKAFQRVKYLMETLTNRTIEARPEDVKASDQFDAVQNNTNYWSYIYCLMSNITKPEDALKIESQMKIFAKSDNISERVINLFKNYNKAV